MSERFAGSLAHAGGSLLMANCIAWGNDPPYIALGTDGLSVVRYSNVVNAYLDTGNIDLDPLFVDATAGDFHLREGLAVY